MTRTVRRRFWIEAALAATSLCLAVLTLITREWIEILFGVDPDGGNGTLEWAIVVALTAATMSCGAIARQEWRRPLATATSRVATV